MTHMEQIMQLSQSLQLSPTLLQSMKILQMNTQELSDYLKTVMEENPTLEEDAAPLGPSWKELTAQIPWLDRRSDPQGGDYQPEGVTPSEEDSLPLFLRDQLARNKRSPQIEALTSYLADLLDDNGYLQEEDLEDLRRTGVPPAMLAEALSLLQSLEPAGIGARNIRECLSIQLHRLPEASDLALLLVSDHLEALSHASHAALAQKLDHSIAEVEAAIKLIKSLEPYPGRAFAPEEPVIYIRPDAYVAELEGQLQIFSNQWDLPSLRISAEYGQMLKQDTDPEVQAYLGQKMQQAQWILHCVTRRQETLHACLGAIVARQQDFFHGKSQAPSPLLQYEVAQELDIHPSTVSRAIRNKYLECRQGLLPLSHFFSRHVGRGPAALSETGLKQLLGGLIRSEDPAAPYSDQALQEQLSLQGVHIARRTVSKYRSELGFPSSYERKKI